MLTNVHIMLVNPDLAQLAATQTVLEKHGAIVHAAQTRKQALAQYWMLVDKNIHPRAIVSSWWINQPDSKEAEFFRMMNRPNYNKAISLIDAIRAVDPRVLVIITQAYIDDMPEKMRKDPNTKFLQPGMAPEAVYAHIAHTPYILESKNRFMTPLPGTDFSAPQRREM
jgi:hypothetical protein